MSTQRRPPRANRLWRAGRWALPLPLLVLGAALLANGHPAFGWALLVCGLGLLSVLSAG